MFVMGLVVRKFLTLKAVAQKTEVAKLRYESNAHLFCFMLEENYNTS